MSPLVATTFWMYVCFADILSGNARIHVEGFPKFATASTARYEWIAVEAVKTESTVTKPLLTTAPTKAVPASTKIPPTSASTAIIPGMLSTVPPGIKETSTTGAAVITTGKETAGEISSSTSTTKVAETTVAPQTNFSTTIGAETTGISFPGTTVTNDKLTTGSSSATTVNTNDTLTTNATTMTSGPLTTTAISATTTPATSLEKNDTFSSTAPPSFMTTLATTIESLFSSTPETNETLPTNLPTTNDTVSTELPATNISTTNEATVTTAAFEDMLFTNGTEMPNEIISMINDTIPTGMPTTNSPSAITEEPLTNPMITGTPSTVTNETETKAPSTGTPSESNTTSDGMSTEVFPTMAFTDIMGNFTEPPFTTTDIDVDKMAREMSTVTDMGFTRPFEDPKVTGLNMSMYMHLRDLEKRISTGEKTSIESLVKVLVLTYRIQQLGGEVSAENRDLLKKVAPLYEQVFNEIITS